MAETNTDPAPSGRIAPELHTIPEVAKRLGVAATWLQTKVRNNEVPYVQTSKVSVRFTDEQVAQIIDLLTVKPRQDPQRLTTSRARKRAA